MREALASERASEVSEEKLEGVGSLKFWRCVFNHWWKDTHTHTHTQTHMKNPRTLRRGPQVSLGHVRMRTAQRFWGCEVWELQSPTPKVKPPKRSFQCTWWNVGLGSNWKGWERTCEATRSQTVTQWELETRGTNLRSLHNWWSFLIISSSYVHEKDSRNTSFLFTSIGQKKGKQQT